ARLDSLIATAQAGNPGVKFRYCTAVEAMQRWRGLTNNTTPVIQVAENVQNQTLTLSITSNVPIFQKTPFICLRDVFQQYQNVSGLCEITGTNSWQITLPLTTNLLAKVGIAFTDEAGNLATRILRYAPGDLYLDNLDPEYSEEQGSWYSTTNASWGTDAR